VERVEFPNSKKVSRQKEIRQIIKASMNMETNINFESSAITLGIEPEFQLQAIQIAINIRALFKDKLPYGILNIKFDETKKMDPFGISNVDGNSCKIEWGFANTMTNALNMRVTMEHSAHTLTAKLDTMDRSFRTDLLGEPVSLLLSSKLLAFG
jgi:hypothetical protein